MMVINFQEACTDWFADNRMPPVSF